MTEVKIQPKPTKEKIGIEEKLIKDMADKIGRLWQIMMEQTDAMNEMRRQLDKVRQRMGL